MDLPALIIHGELDPLVPFEGGLQTAEVLGRSRMIDLARRLYLGFAFPWVSWRAFLDEVLDGTGRDFESFCREGFIVRSQRYRKHEHFGFGTPSGKIELHSPTLEKMGVEPRRIYRELRRSPASAQGLAELYPLVLTTRAKVRSFFHSEYRQISALRRSRPHCRFEIHPETAAVQGIEDASWAGIETLEGEVNMLPGSSSTSPHFSMPRCEIRQQEMSNLVMVT